VDRVTQFSAAIRTNGRAPQRTSGRGQANTPPATGDSGESNGGEGTNGEGMVTSPLVPMAYPRREPVAHGAKVKKPPARPIVVNVRFPRRQGTRVDFPRPPSYNSPPEVSIGARS